MQRADLRDAPRTVSQRKAAAGSTATGVDNETTALRGRQLGYAAVDRTYGSFRQSRPVH